VNDEMGGLAAWYNLPLPARLKTMQAIRQLVRNPWALSKGISLPHFFPPREIKHEHDI